MGENSETPLMREREGEAVAEEKQERLARYERMQRAVEKELTDTEAKMEQLKEQGRVKSVTYRQLMGHKLTYQSMAELYRLYDL